MEILFNTLRNNFIIDIKEYKVNVLIYIMDKNFKKDLSCEINEIIRL